MTPDLTRLIAAASRGEADAAIHLWDRVRDDVHLMAQRALRRRRPGQTLQPTELVAEIYCRIADCRTIPCDDRRYFFGMVARAIEQILADHSRRRRRIKRGGDVVTVSLSGDRRDMSDRNDIEPHAPATDVDPARLQEALAALGHEDEACAEVVRLKVWPGLTTRQVAEVTGISDRSVERNWQYGRLWLMRWMRGSPAP